MASYSDIEILLLDIEGTICPITFVKDTLFPYALRVLPNVLSQQWSNPAFTPYRDAFPAEHRSSPEDLQAYVEDLTRRDVKVACLKGLQGYLWRTGYETGAYATPLYPDVAPSLESFVQTVGRRAAIYSSGSVAAQKLLFAHVRSSASAGSTIDLTSLISAWYDTVNAGPKTEVSSYRLIVSELGVESGKVLFLSDAVKEVRAAEEAGLRVCLVEREGNAPLTREERDRWRVVSSLEELEV